MASLTVRIFSASSSGISISKASSKAMTNSTVSRESAPRSSTKEALGVTSPSSTPSCSTMICFTRSSTAVGMRSAISFRSACTGRENFGVSGRTGALFLGLGVLFDVGYGVLNGADLLRVLVRDFDLEGLFESHDQLDRIQRVGPKIVHEGSAGGHFRFVHTQLLHDDLFHPFFSRSHRSLLSRRDVCRGGQTRKCNCSEETM